MSSPQYLLETSKHDTALSACCHARNVLAAIGLVARATQEHKEPYVVNIDRPVQLHITCEKLRRASNGQWAPAYVRTHFARVDVPRPKIVWSPCNACR